MYHKIKNNHHKILLILILLTLSFVILISPQYVFNKLLTTDYDIIISLLLYLPGFFVLLGLIEAWFPQKFIVTHLGKHSGLRGATYSFLIGAIMPGPLYVAFPIAAILKKKGVSVFNTTLFIGAWSSIKISDELFELHFLGPKFMMIRLILTIPMLIISAKIIEKYNLFAS